ncbi:DUF7225 domain-containing protein [Lysinibacillus capsici]|uniref:DUF7225 domain-containing protein n=1 Tax=Lysinibacillus capsici TaxID=2115968 RepID=UPI00215335F5|nr:hypothetical protein [Lysinibacillus capsici]MCR6522139.1 hypothetical protein [Lysinibacillus capsici]WNN74213.1 hypothetical protein RKS58_12445 [Lysinibacillus capsici]
MTIYEQLLELLKEEKGNILTSKEVKDRLSKKFNTNLKSIILSDYCYNRYNKGISFNKHLFIYINRSTYRFVGENYPYTGLIFHNPKGAEFESVVGEWDKGQLLLYNEQTVNKGTIGISQIEKLYEEYLEMLRFEMNVFGCKATELRHLIGRLGEFFCVLYTKGELAKVTNQHGFDVVKNGRRISVKTTAQEKSFITINKNTFNQFDDLFVVQFTEDDFKILFFGAKEEIPSPRTCGNKYEVDISSLKRISKILY